jgi:glutaredoxin-related protein
MTNVVNVDIIMIALLGLLHYMHLYQSWMDANSQIYVFGEFVGGQQQLVV